MVITYHGDNFFRIQSGSSTLLVDPTNERMKSDLILKTISSPDFSSEPEEENIITSAGEFDINGISIKGVQIKKESTEKFIKSVFSVSFEDIKLCFLGHLSEDIDSKEIEKLGQVQILFLPVGSPPFLSSQKASKIIKQIEPSIIIPSFHQKDSEKELLEELGQKGESSEKLTIKSKDIPEKGSQIIILKKG